MLPHQKVFFRKFGSFQTPGLGRGNAEIGLGLGFLHSGLSRRRGKFPDRVFLFRPTEEFARNDSLNQLEKAGAKLGDSAGQHHDIGEPLLHQQVGPGLRMLVVFVVHDDPFVGLVFEAVYFRGELVLIDQSAVEADRVSDPELAVLRRVSQIEEDESRAFLGVVKAFRRRLNSEDVVGRRPEDASLWAGHEVVLGPDALGRVQVSVLLAELLHVARAPGDVGKVRVLVVYLAQVINGFLGARQVYPAGQTAAVDSPEDFVSPLHLLGLAHVEQILGVFARFDLGLDPLVFGVLRDPLF